jgi:hypothetical protein
VYGTARFTKTLNSVQVYMKLKSLGIWSALALLVVTAACEKSSPTKPSDAGSTVPTAAASATTPVTVTVDAKTGVTITSPIAVSPAPNQQFKNVEQPVTLTIKNAVSTGTAALTYTFEVATDAAFANKVYSKDSVAEGSGQTALKIDKINPAQSYFWRARATGGSNSAVRGFSIGPEVILQAPVLSSPANGSTANGSAPTLIVNNSGRSGPAGQVFYRFEVSDSASFANVVSAVTAPETGGQTSSQVTAKLTANATYFWHVQAADPSNAVTSAFSTVFSFKYVPFDMRQAIILDSPPDLGSWNETAKITSVTFTGDAFLVDFDRRDGPNRWPDLDFGNGGGGTLQYTLGMCLNINNQWYCSAVVQFWFGRELSASTPPAYVGRNWFYDARWGPMAGHQPADGELVGLFAGTGNLRDKTFSGAGCPQVCERTDVAIVPWQNDGSAQYTFGLNGLRVKSTKR